MLAQRIRQIQGLSVLDELGVDPAYGTRNPVVVELWQPSRREWAWQCRATCDELPIRHDRIAGMGLERSNDFDRRQYVVAGMRSETAHILGDSALTADKDARQ